MLLILSLVSCMVSMAFSRGLISTCKGEETEEQCVQAGQAFHSLPHFSSNRSFQYDHLWPNLEQLGIILPLLISTDRARM
jgi:hypothetical protein